MSDKEKFVEIVRETLADLQRKLGGLMQTTHGSFRLGNMTLKKVCEQLALTWEKPNAVEFSELSQHIREFLKK